MIGMPIGPPSQRPEPKSAWRFRPAPIDPTIADELPATGSASTRLFQTLEAGKTGHCGAPGSGYAAADPAVTASASVVTRAARRMQRVSAPTSAAFIPQPVVASSFVRVASSTSRSVIARFVWVDQRTVTAFQLTWMSGW